MEAEKSTRWMYKSIYPEEQELATMVYLVFGADHTDIPLDDHNEVDDDVVDDVGDVGEDDVRDVAEGEPSDYFIVEFDDIGHQGDDEEDDESTRRGPAQDVTFFYTVSHLSELQHCTLIFSANFHFIYIFK